MMKSLLLASSLMLMATPAAAADILTLTYEGTVAGATNDSPFAGPTTFTGVADYADALDGNFSFSSFLIDFGGTQYTLANASAYYSNNALNILGGIAPGAAVTSFNFLTPYTGNPNSSLAVTLGEGKPFAVTPFIGSSQIVSGAGILTSKVSAAVPEPATWAMMLVGFGAVGFSMRRKRSNKLAMAV